MSVRVFESIAGVRSALLAARRRGQTIGFVPTMGALHAGHGRLIEEARRETDVVVVSIFVNPVQFDREDDYELYPRDLARDLTFCGASGADVVFAPTIQEMYPGPQRAFVEVTHLTEHLCGRFRPGHFRGVATVVMKLLNIIQPDRTYFGDKDTQQLAVVRRMIRDLNLPVEIVLVPTVREADGLALSSRNQHLDAEDRRVAAALYRALCAAQERIASGASAPEEIKGDVLAALEGQDRLRVEYVEIVDPEEMQPVDQITAPVRVAAAIWVGSTRLIDNVLCAPPPRG
jgi:pantoate--beta-alanine ligase